MNNLTIGDLLLIRFSDNIEYWLILKEISSNDTFIGTIFMTPRERFPQRISFSSKNIVSNFSQQY